MSIEIMNRSHILHLAELIGQYMRAGFLSTFLGSFEKSSWPKSSLAASLLTSFSDGVNQVPRPRSLLSVLCPDYAGMGKFQMPSAPFEVVLRRLVEVYPANRQSCLAIIDN